VAGRGAPAGLPARLAASGASARRAAAPVKAGAAKAAPAEAGPPPAPAPAQTDFFLCDIFGALPKDDLASMEHPLFSLSTRPDLAILRYAHNGAEIEVAPSVRGRATIHDKDILIYCTSQLVAALNAGRPVARSLHLVAHDLMAATRRETSGDAYRRLRDAFERLAGTRITTNIVTGTDPGQGTETTRGFGLIEDWEIVRRTRSGRMVQVRVTLSDWLFRAILARSVLTLSRDYFDLRRPLERRLYELARKHCGHQPDWRVSLPVLQKKAGSQSPQRVFRAMLREIVAEDRLPGYALEFADDLLTVSARATTDLTETAPPLSEAALDRARGLSPGADVHALAAEWRGFWQRSGRPHLRAPDRAFLGWLARRRPD